MNNDNGSGNSELDEHERMAAFVPFRVYQQREIFNYHSAIHRCRAVRVARGGPAARRPHPAAPGRAGHPAPPRTAGRSWGTPAAHPVDRTAGGSATATYRVQREAEPQVTRILGACAGRGRRTPGTFIRTT